MEKIFVIEFLSVEWIRNTSITIFFILLYSYFSSKIKGKNLLLFLKISALIILGMTLSYHITLATNGLWTLQEDLPLHLCSVSALICCLIFFVKNKQFLFEFLFYSGIIGGLMSILTPQITLYNENYFFYIMFYFKHASIIAIPLVMRYRMKMNLSKHSWLKTFGVINLLLALIIPINSFIGSNYMYVSKPPIVNNPLIIVGESKILGLPDYVFYWEVILFILLILFYFIFKKRKMNLDFL